jgi:hypothetical protein
MQSAGVDLAETRWPYRREACSVPVLEASGSQGSMQNSCGLQLNRLREARSSSSFAWTSRAGTKGEGNTDSGKCAVAAAAWTSGRWKRGLGEGLTDLRT